MFSPLWQNLPKPCWRPHSFLNGVSLFPLPHPYHLQWSPGAPAFPKSGVVSVSILAMFSCRLNHFICTVERRSWPSRFCIWFPLEQNIYSLMLYKERTSTHYQCANIVFKKQWWSWGKETLWSLTVLLPQRATLVASPACQNGTHTPYPSMFLPFQPRRNWRKHDQKL